MRTWGLATRPMYCGKCGALIPEGGALISIELPNLTRAFVRGECCEGAAPPALPDTIVRWNGSTKPMKPLSAVTLKLPTPKADTWTPYKDTE